MDATLPDPPRLAEPGDRQCKIAVSWGGKGDCHGTFTYLYRLRALSEPQAPCSKRAKILKTIEIYKMKEGKKNLSHLHCLTLNFYFFFFPSVLISIVFVGPVYEAKFFLCAWKGPLRPFPMKQRLKSHKQQHIESFGKINLLIDAKLILSPERITPSVRDSNSSVSIIIIRPSLLPSV
jgi:hypothetical protein